MTPGIREAIAIGITVRYGTRLSYDQAAALLGISTSQLKNRVDNLRIKPTYDGNRVFFQIEDVLDYAETSQLEISA